MDSTAEARLLTAIERTAVLTRGRAPLGIGHDDADGTVGTIASDDAVDFDPLPLLRAFDDRGADVVVMGQVAGILHGSSELTGDLDLLWSGDPTHAAAMSAAFADVGAALFDDNGGAVPNSPVSFALPKVDFRSDRASGDCCTPALPWGRLDVVGFMSRADTAVVDGVRVRYLARANLVAMRLAVGRPKDRRRAAELERLGGGAP